MKDFHYGIVKFQGNRFLKFTQSQGKSQILALLSLSLGCTSVLHLAYVDETNSTNTGVFDL